MKEKYLAGLLLLATGTFAVSSCNDDVDYEVATGNILTTVETGEAAVTAVSAEITGTVLDLSKVEASRYAVGVVYGTNQDPTTAGTKKVGTIDEAGNVTTSLSGLTKGSTYYYAVYVTLQGIVTKYGEIKSFVATDAQIATAAATNVTACRATLNGTGSGLTGLIGVDGSEMNFGFKLSTSEAEVQSGRDFTITSSTGSISQDVTGLLPGTTYYYVSYFQLQDGLIYGNVQSFTTEKQDMVYVDLGLSVMWAKYNIGAEAETEAGGFYGYGDPTGMITSEYLVDYASTDISGTENDIATAISGAIDGASENKSQTPTQEQVEELISKTSQEYTTIDGVAGMKFTAKNGNYIFFPAAGYREVESTMGGRSLGLYWTGNVNTINSDYANTINMSSNGTTVGLSKRSLGLSIRSVRAYDAAAELEVDNSKIIVGDIEGNGRLRIEIFNLYGAGTANDSPINTAQLNFSKNMLVTFTVSGIEGDVDCYGGLEYADESWSPSLWSSFNSKYDCHVTGNGTYTVWMETSGETAEGAAVFCIDIDGLHTQLGDAIDNVKVEINSIKFDVDDSQMQYYVDNTNVLFNNKDGNGTDGRIEIYNEYGDTKGMGVDVSDLSFSGYMIVTYTISGIDGNLVDGATKSYKTELSYATPSWYPSYWGGTDFAASTVTGDGTYTVFAPISAGQGTCTGAVVWTIEIYGLWKDLIDGTKVKATIDSVVIPGKQ